MLVDLELPTGLLALALASFNIGVELGQLTLVLILIPLAFWLRHSLFYREGVLQAGSIINCPDRSGLDGGARNGRKMVAILSLPYWGSPAKRLFQLSSPRSDKGLQQQECARKFRHIQA